MREPETHNLSSRTWGYNYEILDLYENGQKLRLSIWYPFFIHKGDYVILQHGEGTTRYQVEEVNYPGDPFDQCFATVIFAPRPKT